MLKKIFPYLFFLLTGTVLFAQENDNKLNSKVVNWGLKAGLNALSSTHYNVWKGDVEIYDKSFTNKVGFVGGLFLRINLDNFFMQPEALFNYTREEFDFRSVSETNETLNNFNFQANYYILSVPVLAGYNIVKEGPFLLNVFAGPDFRYNYDIHFEEDGYSFNDESAKYGISFIAGFSFNISHLSFDLRYEICRPNTNIDFSKIQEAPEYIQDIKIKKNENILSFSCGVMF